MAKPVKKDNGQPPGSASPGLPWLVAAKDGVYLLGHAQPGAKRDAVAGEYNGRLKVAFKAPPVDGKANDYLVKLVADLAGLPKSSVRLVSGETNRTKKLGLGGLALPRAEAVFKA